ncbi:unnamed protein product [Closterium sp. NIES-65]|nr:unnamed protein product [Closterium sp. NIES-65]
MDPATCNSWERASQSSDHYHPDDDYQDNHGNGWNDEPRASNWERENTVDRQQRQQRRQHRHEDQAWEEDNHVGEQERRRPSKEREAKPTRKKKESGGSSSSGGKKAESNGPTIPEEFMCPLSLTVMTDPVIIASGQTYERASIERWFAEGKRTCPKSGVRIDHTNFCPNFALKSMISDWMAQGSGSHSSAARPSTAPAKKTVVKSSSKTSQLRPKTPPPPSLLAQSQSERGPDDQDFERSSDGVVRKKKVVKKKSADGGEERGRKASGSGSGSDAKARARSVSPLPSNLSKKVAAMGGDGQGGDGPTDIKAVWDSIASQSSKPKKAGGLQRHLSYFPRGEDGFGSPADDDDDPPQGPSATGGGGAPGVPRLQRNSSARSTCSMMSMPGGSNDDPGGAPVRRDMGPMVEALNFGSGVDRRAAVRDIRTAIKGCPENKAQLVQLGGIEPLVEVIESDDLEAAEHAVAALMNLSLHWNASGEIVRAGGIPALVGMLNHGTSASQGNAAATLFALSKEDDHKLMVRASGAIPALISLLKTGTVRAKKDAALALFTLSTQSVVECDGLTMFVDLLDEGSSARVKEDAASVLLQLAAMGFVTYGDLLAEGVLPSLVRVSQTSAENSEAKTLLQILRQHCAENKR